MKKLARSLVAAAAHAFALPPSDCADDGALAAAALDAIDGFIAQQSPHRYLTATRVLSALARLRARSSGLVQLARRAIDAELDRLTQQALLPTGADHDDPVACLRALPADPRAPQRLRALAALLEAHQAIAVRVRRPERLRARLEVPDAPLSRGRSADRRYARRPAGRSLA